MNEKTAGQTVTLSEEGKGREVLLEKSRHIEKGNRLSGRNLLVLMPMAGSGGVTQEAAREMEKVRRAT